MNNGPVSMALFSFDKVLVTLPLDPSVVRPVPFRGGFLRCCFGVCFVLFFLKKGGGEHCR